MNRVNGVAVVGTIIATVGVFLRVRADSLATRWQPIGPDAWGGTTDPTLRQDYRAVGLVLLCFGLSVVAMTVWHWLADRRPVPPSGVTGAA